MSETPLVSIIMPAYNAERFIGGAIESVLAQTWQNWELIIVNDGSTDKTADIIKTYKDPRFVVFEQPNKGVSAARNRALKCANGEFIAFLDADDILPPRSLESRATYLLNHDDIAVVDGKVIVKDEELREILRTYQPYYRGVLLPRLLALDDKVFFGLSYMLRKSHIGEVKFIESVSHAEDLIFFTQIANESKTQYSFTNEEIYCYRKSTDSAMSNIEGLEHGYLTLIREVYRSVTSNKIQKLYLKAKVAKILFLSWLDCKEPRRALGSIYRVSICTYKDASIS